MELQNNEAVKEFLKILMKNSAEKGEDYSMMLWQIDNMEQQLAMINNQLQAVKQELSEVKDQQHPIKNMLNALDNKVGQIQQQLYDIKEKIVESATNAIDGFKQTGISALDKAVSTLGIKNALESIQKGLVQSISNVKECINTVEAIGHEIRSAGEHLKNAGRAITGKEIQAVDGGKAGHFQTAVSAPLHGIHLALVHSCNATLAAIEKVERLEEMAETGRNKKASIRQELQSKKEKNAAPSISKVKEKKPQEVTL